MSCTQARSMGSTRRQVITRPPSSGLPARVTMLWGESAPRGGLVADEAHIPPSWTTPPACWAAWTP